jgi:hypothetical protein
MPPLSDRRLPSAPWPAMSRADAASTGAAGVLAFFAVEFTIAALGWCFGATVGMRGCRHRLVGDGVQEQQGPVEELTALRDAVLAYHDQLARPLAGSRSMRLLRRLNRLHLSWLAIPWYLMLGARMVLLGGPPGVVAGEDQAVALYRRRSGKDPLTARVEVGRARRVGSRPGGAGGCRRRADRLLPGWPADRGCAARRGPGGVGGVGGAARAGVAAGRWAGPAPRSPGCSRARGR